MFVFICSQAFHEPYILEVEDVVDMAVSCSNFFVHQLVQSLVALREVGFSADSINAGFVAFIEGDLWCRYVPILYPATNAPG